MSDMVVEWLAAGLAQFREPDPAQAPPRAAEELAGVIRFDADPAAVADFVQRLRAAVLAHGSGEVMLEQADPQQFDRLPRGPALFLRVRGSRRVVLTPTETPILFDEP